jgi:TolB-like protein/DNA-binding winged helix-turn-helix (wHTH) protein
VDGAFHIWPWLVEPGLNTVSRNGTSVRLEPKQMEVLVCLARHAGESVSKEQLLQTVWPDTFVGDDVLTRSIFALRRVFEDDAKDPKVIQTIAKRGYRLILPVTPANGIAYEAPGHAEAEVRDGTKRDRSTLRLGILVGVGLAVLLGAILGFMPNLWRRRAAAGSPEIRSLAVLPLQNLSGDPAQEYFSDGMTEELITELSQIDGLRVTSRTSVMRYKKSDKSLPEIARELGVEGVVEGSVLRSGDRVRITAQLIQPRTDANLWAETYDRNLADTLAVQEAVASAIAGKIKASMISTGTTQPKEPRPVNIKAHDAYLRGLDAADRRNTISNHVGMEAATSELNRKVVGYFEEAIREDPGYAPAYVQLAGEIAAPEPAEAYARKALEADPGLADAHLILAAIRLIRDQNWPAAEKEYLRALELNPSSARAHDFYGLFLDTAGKPDDAMNEFQRAQALDPAVDHLVSALYTHRKFDQLIESARTALGPGPDQLTSEEAGNHKLLLVAYARTGRRRESIEEFRRGLLCMGYKDLAENLRRGYARGGYEGALREFLKGEQKRPNFPFKWLDIYAFTELGDYDQAFARLPKLDPDWNNVAFGTGGGNGAAVIPTLVTLRIEPMWDPLHSDPRFDELVRKVGFPH